MFAKGNNGQLELLEDRIRITRKGFMAFFWHGMKGDKEILLSAITAVQWKAVTGKSAFLQLAPGYIQFSFIGGQESKGGLGNAQSDENTVMFDKAQEPAFQAIHDEIQKRIKLNTPKQNRQIAPLSVADEIKKLAELRDSGILTPDEFNAKKRRLLES